MVVHFFWYIKKKADYVLLLQKPNLEFWCKQMIFEEN